MSTERFSSKPPDPLTSEQQRAVAEFRSLRGTDPFGPFIPLLRSPELLTRVSAVGEYLRFRSALPPRVREFAILITAAHWQQQYEWDYHLPLAREAGVPEAHLRALADGRLPEPMPELDGAVYHFCVDLHQSQQVSDTAYQRAVTQLGENGVVDLIGLCGYYAMLAMVLNTAKTPDRAGLRPRP